MADNGYGFARALKYKANSLHHCENHQERRKMFKRTQAELIQEGVPKPTVRQIVEAMKDRKRYAKSNRRIAYSKTCLNVSLLEPHETLMNRYLAVVDRVDVEREKAGLRRNRHSPINCAVTEVLVAAPQLMDKLPREKQLDFFRDAHAALNKFFGHGVRTADCVYAEVHFDEPGRPHAHFGYVPVTRDNGISVNQIFNGRAACRKFQDYMHAECFAQYGLKRGEPVEKTHRKHIETPDYIAAMEALDEVEALIGNAEQVIGQKRREIVTLDTKAATAARTAKANREEAKKAKAELEAALRERDAARDAVKRAEAERDAAISARDAASEAVKQAEAERDIALRERDVLIRERETTQNALNELGDKIADAQATLAKLPPADKLAAAKKDSAWYEENQPKLAVLVPKLTAAINDYNAKNKKLREAQEKLAAAEAETERRRQETCQNLREIEAIASQVPAARETVRKAIEKAKCPAQPETPQNISHTTYRNDGPEEIEIAFSRPKQTRALKQMPPKLPQDPDSEEDSAPEM